MPSVPRKGKGVYLEINATFLEAFQALARRNRRDFRVEVLHAMERHIAEPPNVVTPPLSPATVTVQSEPAVEKPKGKRGRPAKAAASSEVKA